MKNNTSLLTFNKYLQDSKIREALIVKHAAVSAHIEGVRNASRRARRLFKRLLLLRAT